MTKVVLKQYRNLIKEIAELDVKIKALETNITITSSSQTFPFTQHNNSVAGVPLSKRKEALRLKERRRMCMLQKCQIKRFIDNIDDYLTRRIFELYYIDGERRTTWQAVANKIGERDESYPRRKHNSYLANFSKLADFAENYVVQ